MLGPVLLLLALRDSLVLGFNELPREQGYEVVYPRKVHTQHRRDTQSQYPETVHYKLQYNGRPLELQLEKTEDLLTNNYTETYYLDDGTPVTTSPLWQDHCYYQGRVKNDNNSQVSLSVCHGLSGLITTQEQKLLIKPLNETEDGAHAVYTYQAQEAPKTCGVDHTMYNESIQTKISFSISNSEKTAFLKARKYIQLYIVADYSMYVKYNYNKDRLRERVYGIVNFVNLVYKPLNIFVALTGLEIWDRGDQFEVVTSANVNLDRFSAWRQNKLLPRKPNDNSQFLTHTDFDGATVGLAWVSTLCQDFHSSGVIQDHSTEYIPVGATVAHEMGHNLGMDHDGASCLCSVKSCIMAPILSDTTPREFSSCSHQNYQNFLLNKMPLCMRDMPDKKEVVSSAFCGNKFTEVGEECDCGTEEECTNKCCDAKTCKLKERAQCAEGECCSNCELKAAGTVCRVAKDDCDLSDMCDGTSASCPSDRFKVNGYPCKNGEGHCYNGECPTLQSQCQLRQGQGWGAASSSCFAINREGRDGFCVHNGVRVPCPNRDVNCGVLFCSYRSDRTCYTLNPVLVINGTRCEQDSVCQNGRCISTDNAYQARDCSAKCPKNAECDHELKCHCKEGWAPPNCDTNTDQLGAGSIALIVLVILAVLVIVIIVFLVLYKVSQRRKQRRTTPRSTGVTNPTFNIGKQKPQKQNMHPSYPSTAQATNGNAMYPPRPPAPSQKPQVSAMYPPQPPASSQKPQVSAMYPPQPPTYYPNQNAALGYQRPTNVIPARPPYPAVPPQAMKPNYRR